MKKCDFCSQSSPKGKCLKGGYLYNPHEREKYCDKAIEKMTKALQSKESEQQWQDT